MELQLKGIFKMPEIKEKYAILYIFIVVVITSFIITWKQAWGRSWS